MAEFDPMKESDRLIALSHIDGLWLLPRLKKALTSAVDEARARGHGFIGTEHILLGILNQHDAVATKVLRELGVAEAARDRLIEVMAAPGYLRLSPEVANPELRRELLRRRDVDQAPRRWGRMGGPNEAGGAAVAYLTDRVLLEESGRQRYGTQFTHGARGPEPLPLENPDRVDELRANVGLPPLSGYAKVFLKPP